MSEARGADGARRASPAAPARELRARFRAGDLAGALDLARARGASGDAGCAALLAVARGAWPDALAAAGAALDADARDGLARWCRATARLGGGDRAGALADWTRLLEDDPATVTTWKDRAVARALVGDRAGALADLARAGELAPGDVVPRLWAAALGGPREASDLAPFAAGAAWSARLAALVLGRAEPDALLDVVAREVEDEAERRRRACQVHGYAGLLFEGRDPEGARRRYEAAAATEVWTFLTHLWARERLRDLGAGR